MAQGKKTGGRQKGSLNKRTLEACARADQVAAAIEAIVPGAFDGDAHAFLISVYKDPSQEMAARISAANKAIHFEKPALAATTMSGPGGGPMQVQRIERVIVDPRHAVDTDAPRLRAVAGGKPV